MTCNLTVCNTGNHPTFTSTTVDTIHESIVDITLASGRAADRIADWKVNPDICPASDHHGIEFYYYIKKRILKKQAKLTTFKYATSGTCWNEFKEKLTDHLPLEIKDHNRISNMNSTELDNYIHSLTNSIQTFCDDQLPCSRPREARCPWWNDDLEQSKAKVIKQHHKLSRLKRQGRPLDEAIALKNSLRLEYSKLFSEYSNKHFREFCNRQGKEDVWAVTNRIIKTAPAPQPPTTIQKPDGTFTQTPIETAEAILHKFFPDDTPDTRQAHLEHRIQSNLPPPNTPNEPPSP
ncbi:uncharacterized protein LOC131854548 [Achroia grisella]|uniref:uncharacterized protein LOC131854548 n=1 Tax=Achroia grisella TaxID=688607 RepID=UPI0027D2656D|nr:uncharacterized protein LOC131854548 [Achroia grisella]